MPPESPPPPPTAAPHDPRRLLLGVLGAALLAAGMLLTYQIALARVPHHRAAIERVLRAYSGLDLRFASLEFRWGWYGPEAVFSQVELREPPRSGVRMHAQRLTVGFSSWSSVRSGQLQISRVTLIGPDIDLTALAPAAAPPDAPFPPPPPAKLLDPRLLTLLERAPLGHMQIEEGTVRLRDARFGAATVVLHVSRAQLARSVDGFAASGSVYLPERLGRSVYLALELQGDLDRPAQLTGGSVRLVGRKLAIGPLGDWYAQTASRPQLALARSGVGDLKLDLKIAHGEVARGAGALAVNGLALRAISGELQHSWERVHAELDFTHAADADRLEVHKLALVRDGEAVAHGAMTLEWRTDGQFHGTLETLPAAALMDAAAAIPALHSLAALDQLQVQGNARLTEIRWNGSAPAGRQWSITSDLTDLDVRIAHADGRLAHLAAAVSGDESELTVRLAASAATLASTQLTQDLAPVALNGELRFSAQHESWSLRSAGVRVVWPEGDVRVGGTFSAPAGARVASANPQFDLQIAVAKLDRAALDRYVGTSAPGAPLALIAALAHSGEVGNGEIRLRGTLQPGSLPRVIETRGEVELRHLVLFGDQRWPAAEDVAGRLSWVNERARLTVDRGTVAGLVLTQGERGVERGSGAAHQRARVRLARERTCLGPRAS